MYLPPLSSTRGANNQGKHTAVSNVTSKPAMHTPVQDLAAGLPASEVNTARTASNQQNQPCTCNFQIDESAAMCRHKNCPSGHTDHDDEHHGADDNARNTARKVLFKSTKRSTKNISLHYVRLETAAIQVQKDEEITVAVETVQLPKSAAST